MQQDLYNKSMFSVVTLFFKIQELVCSYRVDAGGGEDPQNTAESSSQWRVCGPSTVLSVGSNPVYVHTNTHKAVMRWDLPWKHNEMETVTCFRDFTSIRMKRRKEF